MLKICLQIFFILTLSSVSALAQPPSTAGLRGQIEQIAGTAQGRVGATATVLETGESVSFDGNKHFPMQSVYKLPIGMAVLERVDRGSLKLEQKIHVDKSDFVTLHQYSPIRDKNPQGVDLSLSELLRFSVSESDGTACDVLLRVIGGTKVVDQYLHRLGIQNLRVETTEKAMGQDQMVQYRNWATPDAMVALLRILQEGRGLSAASRALLMKWLTESPTGAHRIKGLLPVDTVVAHKTGTSGTSNGLTRATNDVGIITLPDGRHLALAVFVSDSKADEATREGVIAKIAQATWNFWSGPHH
jgi:beta-lactamase class A